MNRDCNFYGLHYFYCINCKLKSHNQVWTLLDEILISKWWFGDKILLFFQSVTMISIYFVPILVDPNEGFLDNIFGNICFFSYIVNESKKSIVIIHKKFLERFFTKFNEFREKLIFFIFYEKTLLRNDIWQNIFELLKFIKNVEM